MERAVPPFDTENERCDSVMIAGREVSPGRPALVVAEAGVNHDGDVDRALRLVDAAADVGADAVKFQIFHAADLTTADAPAAGYQLQHGGSQHAMLCGLELPDDAFAAIKRRCDQRSLLFLATPFGHPELGRLLGLCAPAVKIASTDLTNAPLLAAAAATGLPILLSTGAATLDEIDAAVDLVTDRGARRRLVLLHCVSRYPTPIDAANLRAVPALRARFDVPTGLSDHTMSTHVGAWAVALGACVLEKHLTLDRAARGPDHAMSLTPAEFADYVGRVRELESALGHGRPGMTPEEFEVRAVAGKSIVAARDIPAGAVLTPDMLAIKRPGTGLSPAMLESLLGRVLTAPIRTDTLLRWELVR